MKKPLPISVIIFLLHAFAGQAIQAQSYPVKEDSLQLFDSSRKRVVPLTIYIPSTKTAIKRQRLVIISHGYNANQPGASKSYSYIGKALAAYGYYVASIQHELPTDDLIPNAGVPQVVRRPFWERGVANILFVLNTLKKIQPGLDYRHTVLIGHSNGGDMSMLFAQLHPLLADKVISLDNRRMALPRTRQPHIYSIRSSDQPADEGVLPSAEEQRLYSIQIIPLRNTIHNDMGDNGTEAQRKEINRYIRIFLK
jgi:pimeloyl-ACP methyl ester carboxylesterase